MKAISNQQREMSGYGVGWDLQSDIMAAYENLNVEQAIPKGLAGDTSGLGTATTATGMKIKGAIRRRWVD